MMIEIDYNALVKSIQRAIEKQAVEEFIRENADDDHTVKSLLRYIGVFERHGIGAFEAMKIMKELEDTE